MRATRIGLYGGGFMAKAHRIGYTAVDAVFGPLPAPPVVTLLADRTEALAAEAARRLSVPRWTASWRALVEDPDIDVVDITGPSAVHLEIAEAALAAGKHVYCEKPLGLGIREARRLAAAAARAGTRTVVGFNYLNNPMIAHARRLIEEGEIGEVVHVRARHNEDFLADPGEPMVWRCDRAAAGAGAVGDLGSHALALVRYLAGEVEAVSALLRTVIADRPARRGGADRVAVTNDDEACLILSLAGGASGTLEASRIAVGRTMGLAIEVTGTSGAIRFDQERLNELEVVRRGRGGITRLEAGPQHAPYGRFCPAPGHQLGFNDLKTIEIAGLLAAIHEGAPVEADFAFAAGIAAVVAAAELSSAERRWVAVDEAAALT